MSTRAVPTGDTQLVEGAGRLTRWWIAQLAGTATLGLAGAAGVACAGPAGSSAGGDTGAGGRKALGPAKITFFTHWGAQHQKEGQEKTLAAFEQDNSGLTVEMFTGSATADKIVTAIAGGVPPDLVAQSAGRLIPLAIKSTWKPLEDYMKTSAVARRDNYSDVQLKLFTWKGKLYGVPAYEHSGLPALAYNVLHYQEAGLDPAKPPRLPDELYKAHEKLTVVEGGIVRRLGIDPRDASGGGYTS